MKLLITALLYLLPIVVFAQEQFVEVVVTDTIVVPADHFVFQVMAMPEDMAMEPTAVTTTAPIDYPRREREMRQRQKQSLDTLEAKLRRAGFNPAPLSISDMAAGRGYGNYFLTYQLTSEEDLRRFQAAIRNQPSINSVLQSAVSMREKDYQQRLYTKLMEKARGNATALASLAGRKIGRVMMVSENGADENSRWNPYLPVISSRRPGMRGDEVGEVNTSYGLRGKLLVRYEW